MRIGGKQKKVKGEMGEKKGKESKKKSESCSFAITIEMKDQWQDRARDRLPPFTTCRTCDAESDRFKVEKA